MKKKSVYNKKLNIEVGKKIKFLRKSKGLTENDLAEYFNVSQQQISRYERGVNNITISFLADLSILFKVPICFFLA